MYTVAAEEKSSEFGRAHARTHEALNMEQNRHGPCMKDPVYTAAFCLVTARATDTKWRQTSFVECVCVLW
jgi:hypothetical protein